MEKRLVVIAGPDKDKAFLLPETGTFSIGRSRDTQTQLTDRKVSRIHCELQLLAQGVIILDKGSSSGTFINDERLGKDDKRPIRSGDLIRIGDTQLRYESDEDLAEEATVIGSIPVSEVATIAAAPPLSPAGGGVALAPAPSLAALVGTTLGHYTITKFLTQGRTSALFRAQDNAADRLVTLKVLHDGSSKSEAEMLRLARTLKPVLSLRHPNLMALYDLGWDKGKAWFALEWVEGDSLAEVIKRAGMGGLLDWQHALRVALHVARGLEALHQHKLVHTKITPRCIYINSLDKVAKLGGLWEARTMEAAKEKPPRAEAVLAYAGFASPERARNVMHGDVRSDIYSLGATLYAMLTGRAPFESSDAVETLTRVIQPDSVPTRPKEIQFLMPDGFEQIVLRMLAKKPEDRYQTATDLLEDLDRLVRAQSSPSLPTPVQQASPGPASAEGTLRITCGGCGQPLKPRRKFIGTQVRCPTCKKFLLVPENEGVVQPVSQPTMLPQQPPTMLPQQRATIEPRPATWASQGSVAEGSSLPKPVVAAGAILIILVGLGYFVVTSVWWKPEPPHPSTEKATPTTPTKENKMPEPTPAKSP